MVSASTKLEGPECILVCCYGVTMAVDIAILVIAYDEASFTDCGDHGKPMALVSFAKMAGWIGIALAIISICFSCFVCPARTDRANMKNQAIWLSISSLIYIIIAIIGFLTFDSVDMDFIPDCQSSSLGSVVLAWCIIRIVSACCGCIQSLVAIIKES